ncbi:hypothetical protein F2P79_010999 [Pimephales promelas]|nr:hypothetical protein F2P79_010999 [Pimephales promelas]
MIRLMRDCDEHLPHRVLQLRAVEIREEPIRAPTTASIHSFSYPPSVRRLFAQAIVYTLHKRNVNVLHEGVMLFTYGNGPVMQPRVRIVDVLSLVAVYPSVKCFPISSWFLTHTWWCFRRAYRRITGLSIS